MKWFLTILLCLAVMLGISFAWGQQVGGGGRQANTISPIPLQVMGEGRLTGFSAGTVLTTENISNLFAGNWCTNGTWTLYTNGGAVVPTLINSSPLDLSYGFYMPTVTRPEPTSPIVTNQALYYQCNLGGDVCPQFIYTPSSTNDGPVVMVAGFTLTISNWTGDTFRGYDIFRMGQSPYVIVQLYDHVSDIPQGDSLRIHTPDGAGVGNDVVILDNGETYKVVALYDGPRSNAACAVYQQMANGTYRFRGESKLLLTEGLIQGADRIFFGQNDDHSPASGTPGQIRMSKFWMNTNREVFYNRQFPQY